MQVCMKKYVSLKALQRITPIKTRGYPYLAEAAGIIRPSSSPLRGRRRFALALSRAFALG
jgi:hypothetical protein